MTLGTILIIILVIFLLGGFSGRFRGYGYGYGHSGMGLVGVILIVLLILVLLGGGGFALHVLWYLLIAALILWLIGFFVGGSGTGRWYGR